MNCECMEAVCRCSWTYEVNDETSDFGWFKLFTLEGKVKACIKSFDACVWRELFFTDCHL